MDGGGCVIEHRVAPADRQQGNGDCHLNELGSGLKILKNSKEICIHLDLSNNHDTSHHLKRMVSFYHDHGFLPFPHIIISSNSHVLSFICVFYLFRIPHNFGISWKGTSFSVTKRHLSLLDSQKWQGVRKKGDSGVAHILNSRFLQCTFSEVQLLKYFSFLNYIFILRKNITKIP